MPYTSVAERRGEITPEKAIVTPEPLKTTGYIPVAERQVQEPVQQAVEQTFPTATPEPFDTDTEEGRQSAFEDAMDLTSGFLTSGTARAIGGITDAATKTAFNAANFIGAGFGKGVFKTIGLVEKALPGESKDIFSKLGDKFYNDMRAGYKDISQASTEISSFLARGGQEAKDIITRDVEIDGVKRADRVRDEDFKMKDLSDPKFWAYDVYEAVLENAPTMIATLGVGAAGTITKSGVVARWLSQAVPSTAFGTAVNASIESESAFSEAIESGATKDQAFARSGGRCECTRSSHTNHTGRCPTTIRRHTAEYHHRVSESAGGGDGLSNCEALCVTCHRQTGSYGG